MNLARTQFWLLALIACSSAALAEIDPPKANRPAALPIAELKRDTPVDFEKEILPVLKNNCLACHNQTKAKASLILETPQTILKGGDSGPGVTPGKAIDSLLLKAAAHQDPELIMPPTDNKVNASSLTSEQLALLKLWIDQGAKGDVRSAAPVHWLEKPPSFDPILAVALTPDGQFAACGRGNQIFVYHVPSGQLLTQLFDRRLAGADQTEAAHRDLVNALAFNPDGTLLASASYREVKLWRRSRDVQKFSLAVSNAFPALALSPDRHWLAVATPKHGVALWDLSKKQRTRTLAGHSNAVTALKFSPDGQQLCSGSADQTLRIWNTIDGSLAAATETLSAVNAVAWLSGSKRIAAGSTDGLIRVWRLPGAVTPEPPSSREGEAAKTESGDGKSENNQSLLPSAATNALVFVKELKGHEGSVTSLEVLPGGQELLSGSSDGTLRQWKFDEDKATREIKHGSPVIAVAVRPDGHRWVSAGTNHVAKLWNAEGKLIAELKGDRYAYEQVAATERDLVVAKSDVEFRKKSLETAEAEHKKQTERVAKATDTNSVTEKILAEKDKALKDAQQAKTTAEKAREDLLAEIKKVTESFETADKTAKEATTKAKAAGEKATRTQLASDRAALSKTDAERIATDAAAVAAKTKAATSNDLPDEAKAAAARVAEDAAVVAQKTKTLAEAIAADAEAKSKMATETKTAADKAIEELAAQAFAAGQLKPGYDKLVAEAPEKRKQATNQVESTIKALAGAEQELKKTETRKSITAHELELAQQAQKRTADELAEATSSLADTETAQKKTESSLERHKIAAASAEQSIRALAFSPDGRTIASLGEDQRVHTWSAENGAAFEIFPHNQARASGSIKEAAATNEISSTPSWLSPHAVAFVNATTLLAGSADGRLLAWELDPAWTLERTIGTGDLDSPLSDRVNAVRFSPDGLTLATGSGEPTRGGEIKLWNARDGQFQREFRNVHSDSVLSLDFSPDGKYLASSSADRFVRVVDLASGQVVKALEGHTSYVLGVAWKRDSRTLVSAGADNVIKVWDFATGARKKNIDGASKEVTSIAFVGVTDQAVATSGDSQVRLVRDNGDKVRSFEGATDFMNSAAATPDGQTIVAGGQDSVLRVWNGADGKLLTAFPRPSK